MTRPLSDPAALALACLAAVLTVLACATVTVALADLVGLWEWSV